MPRPRKAVDDRAGSTICLSTRPEELTVFDLYCEAKGLDRTTAFRLIIRRLRVGDLNEAGSQFRRALEALPPMEEK